MGQVMTVDGHTPVMLCVCVCLCGVHDWKWKLAIVLHCHARDLLYLHRPVYLCGFSRHHMLLCRSLCYVCVEFYYIDTKNLCTVGPLLVCVQWDLP